LTEVVSLRLLSVSLAIGLSALACSPHRSRGNAPPTLSLIDFEGSDDTSRVTALRDDCPYPASGECAFRIVAERGGGHSLRLDYSLTRHDTAPIGVRIALGDLDASAYDHLQLRLRAGTAGAAAVRVGFRRSEPGGRGLVQNGSTPIRAIETQWKSFSIPLGSLVGIDDWTHLDTVFVAAEPRESGQQGAVWVDDIALVRTDNPGPRAAARPPTPRKRAWSEGAARDPGIFAARRARLAGWPSRLLIERRELPTNDAALLRRLAADTWRGLDALRDREHGLPLDTVSFTDSVEQAKIGDYTNITNVGLYLLSIAAAHELALVDRAAAVERGALVLDTLERLETHAGFFFNYYDTTSLEPTSYFVSFIDSAWLTAGLMVLRNAFPELATRATALIERGDFAFFYDQARGLMSHGFFVQLGVPSEYHYGLLYTEARIGSLIAIGKGDVPAAHWQRLLRVFPPACFWQTQIPHRDTYAWKGVRFVPSWGGSMFEALMPTLVVDEQHWAPQGLGPNGVRHATIQRRWAEEVTHLPIWGSSPSRNPDGTYREYGVPPLGVRGYDGSVVTPHAAALALAVTPDTAIANLRRIVEVYDIYGEYGLYDAVDPTSGRVAHDYLALDQAMTLIALANYLAPHSVQKLFAADPIAQRVLPGLADERFFE